ARSYAFFLPPLLASPKKAVNLGRVPVGVGRYPTRQNQPKVRVLAWSIREMPGTLAVARDRAAGALDLVDSRRVAMGAWVRSPLGVGRFDGPIMRPIRGMRKGGQKCSRTNPSREVRAIEVASGGLIDAIAGAD